MCRGFADAVPRHPTRIQRFAWQWCGEQVRRNRQAEDACALTPRPKRLRHPFYTHLDGKETGCDRVLPPESVSLMCPRQESSREPVDRLEAIHHLLPDLVR